MKCATFLNINENQNLCGSCLSKAPYFDQIIPLFDYQPPISSLIMRLKFSGDLSIAALFSQLWIRSVTLNKLSLPELIIPVPLHPERLKQRGFNQSLEIAKRIGKHFKIPIDTRACIRIKNTQAQSSLNANKRKNNVKNAFGLSYPLNAKHIVIIDDVVTTGNTASEISALLKKAGAEMVDVWCCAKTQ